MNSNVKSPAMLMGEEELKNLVNEVKETVAAKESAKTIVSPREQFRAIDLWNIHRKGKTAVGSSRRWNLN